MEKNQKSIKTFRIYITKKHSLSRYKENCFYGYYLVRAYSLEQAISLAQDLVFYIPRVLKVGIVEKIDI